MIRTRRMTAALAIALASVGYGLLVLSWRGGRWTWLLAGAIPCLAISAACGTRLSKGPSLRILFDHVALWVALWGASGYVAWILSGRWGFAGQLPYLSGLLGFGSGFMYSIIHFATMGVLPQDPKVGAAVGAISGAWAALITLAMIFLASGYGIDALTTALVLVPVAIGAGIVTGAISAIAMKPLFKSLRSGPRIDTPHDA